MPPAMFAMELITCNEKVDEEIKNLYETIIAAEEEAERNNGFDSLNSYKKLRDSIDDVITELMDETDDEKLKKIVKRNLRLVSSELKQLAKDCRDKYGCGGGCDSCAADVLKDAISRTEGYRSYFDAARETPGDVDVEEDAKEAIRTDMINYINEISGDSNIILRKKVEEGSVDECEQEKLDIYSKIKAPLWMLVNTTIFAPSLDDLEAMVVEMTNSMDQLLAKYCNEKPTTKVTTDDGPTCEWDEYEQTKNYLTKVDEIIQEALFKAKDESAQMTALLGFVDIQTMFDKRVKKLFEDSLACPDEVTFIKKTYMPGLAKCMAQFMNGRLKFEDMSRIERISCTKVLRNGMETRMSELLSAELDKSLNQIGEDGVKQ